jgi:hypothetical protein
MKQVVEALHRTIELYNNKQHKALCLMVPNQMEKVLQDLHHFIQLVATKQKGQNDKNNGGKCLYWFRMETPKKNLLQKK